MFDLYMDVWVLMRMGHEAERTLYILSTYQDFTQNIRVQ